MLFDLYALETWHHDFEHMFYVPFFDDHRLCVDCKQAPILARYTECSALNNKKKNHNHNHNHVRFHITYVCPFFENHRQATFTRLWGTLGVRWVIIRMTSNTFIFSHWRSVFRLPDRKQYLLFSSAPPTRNTWVHELVELCGYPATPFKTRGAQDGRPCGNA